MISITIIGTGIVAKHLCDAFALSDSVILKQVIGRNKKALLHFQNYTETSSDYKGIKNSDIYIIAISDDVIRTIAEYLTEKKGLIVHTSGSISVHALPKENRTGVFYPLQTFSDGRKIDFNTVPICIEAEDEHDLALLKKLAGTISGSIFEISSDQRRPLHLAAVFVNNFTNHLYAIGQDICQENELPFDLLKPLLLETAKKIGDLSPIDAQTGPARRKDQNTIDGHLKRLRHKNQKEIYKVLTRSIKETYGEKL
ncbi:FIG137884: hypothetical protein [hydrothermal vent metagenome]|uniref:DUF2520 domain-containing protein n=1 Tax=hydrothermal vent metagenome TaxID=652676 RepID=A0A3B0SWC2_9ZZZZ